ncbi:MAG: hypothetical protein C0412_16565, partial [Flavobacterium sp.]|nr:hypothetical protein [Flavobacterium sp.]
NESAKKYYDLMVEQIKTDKHSNADSSLKKNLTKAYCDANIVRIGRSDWILKLFNKGDSIAKEVSFKFLGDQSPDVLITSGKEFPLKMLEPQKNVDYHFLVTMNMGSESWEYGIVWTNEDGTRDGKKGILTLPLS